MFLLHSNLLIDSLLILFCLLFSVTDLFAGVSQSHSLCVEIVFIIYTFSILWLLETLGECNIFVSGNAIGHQGGINYEIRFVLPYIGESAKLYVAEIFVLNASDTEEIA